MSTTIHDTLLTVQPASHGTDILPTHGLELQSLQTNSSTIEPSDIQTQNRPFSALTQHAVPLNEQRNKSRPPPITIDHESSRSSPVSHSPSASENSPMYRRTRSSYSPQPNGQSVEEEQNGHTEGRRSGDSMDSKAGVRRKHLVLDSPTSESQTAYLMGREGFSLDHDVPQTPKTPGTTDTSFFDLPKQDQRNFLLLVLLYFLQGVPMGLAGGSVPFLLKQNLSYGQIGVFSLASYPYSLKLLWSPIVDAVWTPKLGRRKSWIVPIQICSGFGMIYLGGRVKEMMVTAGAADGSGVWAFTRWWFFLVFLCATQDIAVDGWALTLLSPPSLSYASTAQTVGLTAGHFLSYTVFLALESSNFANRWFRTTPSEEGVLTLGGYLTFWGWAYLAVTAGLTFLKREEKTNEREGILSVYRSMIGILKLKSVQSIIVIHLIAKIGFQANDAVTNLKLLDMGFSQEDMALTVLLDFPFEICLAYYAARWSMTVPPVHIWCYAFIARLLAAMVAQGVVMLFPADGVQTWYLLTVIASHMFSTFTSTIMFVAIAAFHTKISDPLIGGTYMTLLATVSNLGGTFPRFPILKLVDIFTVANCIPPIEPPKGGQAGFKGPLITAPFSCVAEAEKHRCIDGGGTCDIKQDGYYITNVVCVMFGILTFIMFIRPAAMKLQALPLRAWRLAGTRGR